MRPNLRLLATSILVALFLFVHSFAFGQAIVTSDKDDYPPLSNAVFSGSGFAAFETVTLKVKNLNQPCNTVSSDSSYLPWTVVADQNGAFVTNWTVCNCAGDSLRLKAVGQTSGLIAYAYFTDANLNQVTVGNASQSVNYGTAATVTYTVSVKATSSGSGPTGVTLSATGLPAGVTYSWSSSSPNFVAPNIVNFPGATTVDVTLTLTVPNNTDVPASPAFTVTATAGGTSKTDNGTLTINRKQLTGGITADNKFYDGNTAATILTRTLSGVLFSDDVSLSGGAATFADKSPGTKTVTATGLTLSGAKAGNYTLGSTTATTSATITAKPLTPVFSIADKVYDGNTSAAITNRQLTGIIGNEKVTLTGGTATFSDKNVGANKNVTVSAPMSLTGADAGNYSIGTVGTTTASITVRTANISFTVSDKAYDGTTTAAITAAVIPSAAVDPLHGLIAGDNVTVNFSSATAIFGSKDVAATQPQAVSASGFILTGSDGPGPAGNGNYQVDAASVFSSTANMSPLSITINFTASNKIYDGLTSATILTRTLVGALAVDAGKVSGGQGTAAFDTKNVGTGKTVTATGFVLTGSAKDDYALVPNSATTTADITTRSLNVTAQTDSRVYNGTTSSAVAPIVASLQTGDNIATAPTQVYNNRNVGTGKTLTASGLVINDGNSGNNYSVTYVPNNTGIITATGLTVTAQTDNRVYNGTASSTVAPLVPSLQTGDNIATAPMQVYNNRNVGTGKTLTASGLVINDGNGGNNYSVNYIPDNTGIITAKGIDVTAQTDNRVYNGTTSSTVSPVVPLLQTGDNITTAPTQVYNNRNVGAGKTLTASGLVINDGNGGNNYSINYVPDNTGVISVRGIDVTAQTDNRVYNGTASSTVAPVVPSLQTGDNIVTAPTQVYNNRNVGTGKTLTASGLVINDGNGGNNYSINYIPDNTGVITARGIDVTAQTDNRVYNGTASSTVAPVVPSLQTGDNVTTAPTQVYNNRNVGTGKTLTASGIVINDGNGGNNYSVNYIPDNTGIITARGIDVTAQTDNRVYNGTANSTVAPLVPSLQTGDNITTAPTQVYDNRNVGTGKTLTASGLVINDGNGGNNYSVNYVPDNTGVITVRGIDVTAQTDNRVYNGTTSSTVAPVVPLLQTGDNITTAPTQVYNNRNVGTGKTLTASGLVINDGNGGNNYSVNYIPDNTGVISVRGIDVTAQTDNRVYNGTASSSVLPVVPSLQTGDNITTAPMQVYNNRNVGTGKTLTASGLVINDGNGGNNYSVNYIPDNTGIITAKGIDVTAQTDNRVYNGTTSSSVSPVVPSLQTGDNIATAPTQVYNNRNVGTGKTLTASGLVINDGNGGNNYSVSYIPDNTGVITTKGIDVTAQTDNRVYNGTTSSTVSPLVPSLQTGDNITTAPTQVYNNRNVGIGKTLTASGLVINDGNGGNNYSVNYIPDNTGVITARGLDVTAQADNRVYNGTTSSTVAPLVPSLQTGDNVTTAPTQVYNNRNVGIGKTLTASGLVINDGNGGNNYSVNYVPDNTGVITARGIDVTAQTDNRVYNGTTSSTVAPIVPSLQTGDIIATAPTQVYNNRNVGVGKTLTASGLVINDGNGGNNYSVNYVPDNTGVITVRGIDVTAQTDNRIYNGTTSSTVAPLVPSLQTGDNIATAPTQVYNNRNVGIGKTLTASGLVINDGNGGNNYSVSYIPDNTGIITTKGINVTAQTDNRVYNGTASSTVAPTVPSLQTGDNIATAPSQVYNNRNVGTGKTLTASGLVINDGNGGNNYSVNYIPDNTGIITARGIDVTAQTDNRVYNGTTSSTVAPIVPSLQTGDIIATAPTQVYNNRNVGVGKTLTASGLVINDGNGGNNYSVNYIPDNTGIITARGIDVTAQTDNRVYNGTANSTVAPLVPSLQTGDNITTAPTQVYDNRNVGTGKTLTASGLVINDGNGGNNYSVNYISDNTGVITARGIDVTAQTDNRVYNGTTSSTVAPVVPSLQTGDNIGTAPTQVYNNRNVGTGKTLTASGLVINDGNGGNNYSVNYIPDNTGVITVRGIDVTAQTDNRVYNGTTSSTVSPVVPLLQTGDNITTAPTQVYNNRNVGTGKTLTASGLVINDGNGGNNYSVTYVPNNTGIITARDLNVTAQTDSRVYNGTTSSTVASVVDPLQPGDVIGTAPVQKYDTKNVGTNKTLTPAGLVINDGNSGLNYVTHYITNTTGVITALGITGSVTVANKVYDGNTSATIATRTLTGAITGDYVSYSGGTATFDDIPVGTGQNVGNNKPVSITGLSLSGGDKNNYTVNTSAVTTANITQAGLTITADNLTVQYSDPVVFTVKYEGFVAGDGVGSLGGGVTFSTTPAATTGTNPVIATGAPGTYTITPVGLTSSNYAITFKPGTLTINREDAKITYTGSALAACAGTSTTATLTLSATIQDITAVPGDACYDANPGDIRKATITFNVDGVDKATVAIGLVNSDTKTGTAVYNFAGAGLGDHTILLKLNGYYTNSNSGDNQVVVEVYQSSGDFITGGGYLNLTNSNGQKSGDAGTKNNFGFNVKYNKGGTNLQGTINTIVRRMEGGILHIYQVKGNSMTSLAVNATATPPTAVFNGKANITDITNPSNPVSLGGNCTLQVSMTDGGDPGTADKIGITVYNNSGGLWFTSNWDGSKTIQQTLAGGNLIVHSSSNVGNTATARSETVATDPNQLSPELSDKFSVKVLPTISQDYFVVNVQSNTQEAFEIKVYDFFGRQIEMARGGIGQTLRIGHNWSSGTYILSVSQGKHLATIKVTKL